MIEFQCSYCKASLKVVTEHAGRQARCPKCGNIIRVPLQSTIANLHRNGYSAHMSLSPRQAARILGVSHNASSSELRKAYHSKVILLHPETGEQQSARQLVEVTAAFQTLMMDKRGIIRNEVQPSEAFTWEYFAKQVCQATKESYEYIESQRQVFASRLYTLVENQLNTYSSAEELRNRAKEDIDAIIQRELWAFIQRVSRRSDVIEKEFRSWVQRIRITAYETELPHGVLEFLSRPVGIFSSFGVFSVLGGVGVATLFYMHPSWLQNSLITTALMISGVSLLAFISVACTYSICMASWRAKLRHQAIVDAGDINFDGLSVGAIPIPEGLSAEERAGSFGAGVGALSIAASIWLGVEPVTGLIATGIAAGWGWLTGKTLKKIRRDTIDAVSKTLDMRLDDFFDSFVHKLFEANCERLRRMREVYWRALGPDPSIETEEAVSIHLNLNEVAKKESKNITKTKNNADTGASLIREIQALCFEHNVTNIYVHPKIPENKLGNAVGQYAKNCKPNDIILLYDATVFGSAREGMCLTENTVQWNINGAVGEVKLGKLTRISCFPKKGIFGGAKLIIDGNEINFVEDKVATVFEEALRIICRLHKK